MVETPFYRIAILNYASNICPFESVHIESEMQNYQIGENMEELL